MTSTEIDPSSFTKKLNASAKILASNRAQRPPKSIHVSSYFECGRKQYYGLTGEPKSDDVEWLGYEADIGNTVHEKLQQRLAASGMAYMIPNFDENKGSRHIARQVGSLSPAIEVPLTDYTLPAEQYQFVQEHRLGGRIDAIIMFRGEPAIFEIKSTNNKTFDNPNYLIDKLGHYEMQVQMYLHVYRTPENQQLKRGFIYIVNPGDLSRPKMFSVDYQQGLMVNESDRVKSIKLAIDDKEPPAPEPHRGPCRFCAWRSKCPASEGLKR